MFSILQKMDVELGWSWDLMSSIYLQLGADNGWFRYCAEQGLVLGGLCVVPVCTVYEGPLYTGRLTGSLR